VATLREAGVRMTGERKKAEGHLLGKSFVITGTLESLSRDAAKDRIEALGGKVVGTVSKKTDFVVVGESPGTKLEKAQKLGVATLDAAAFRAVLGGPAPAAEAAPSE
ncbi:MAG: BRCT domain-containing protein, partial [Polyangiaceae bacterium]